ncbi:MAG: D-2-hydroxyacid dehydrogenase [Deltaproteobacteria bacterium]|nr:D-2-hydroxyacid dehydrogenase [Deltaproteobacteria bacterium]
MIEILIYEVTYQRVQEEFESRVNQVRPLIFTQKGEILREGETVPAESVQPEIAWASSDLYVGEDSPTREFMIYVLKSESIRWLQSGAAGFEHPVFGMLVDKGIRLTNNNASSIAIAEYVLSGVLNHYHSNQKRRENQHNRMWQRLGFREIYGTVWLIIGLGNIGTEVSRRAQTFGAHTIGVKRTITGNEQADTVIQMKDLSAYLSKADVVILSAPLNKETEKLVNKDFLQHMKGDSILVNIARGPLVDEDALLESLDKGQPELAILDVFSTEPLPSDSPLWSHPRVHMTSHFAGSGSGSNRRGDGVFFDNLDRYLAKKPLQMEVDKSDLPS